MSASDKANHIKDVIFSELTKFDGSDLGASQSLLDNLSTAMKTTNIISELAQTNPDIADHLHGEIQKLAQMQVLVSQVQAAEAVGDTDAMLKFSQEAAALGGVETTVKELPAPFDALQDAIEEGDMDALKQALSLNPDLNQYVGKYGSFPLLWAMTAEDRTPAMLAALVDAGADVNFATSEGYTALHYVADYVYRYDVTVEDDYAIASYLVRQGADLTARNHYGWTPLDRAIHEGVTEEVHALLRAGADPNAKRSTPPQFQFELGETPLVNALSEPDQVALLLEFGADPKAEVLPGQTAFDVLEEQLEEETPEGYTEYYDGLRASRALLMQIQQIN